MPLGDVTSESVLAAVREYDQLGREAFLRSYGFRPARDYFLRLNGQRYDSKAIVGAAHKFALPAVGPLQASQFSGGEATVARVLEQLGLSVQGPRGHDRSLPALTAGQE